jgi:hypothetical protein
VLWSKQRPTVPGVWFYRGSKDTSGYPEVITILCSKGAVVDTAMLPNGNFCDLDYLAGSEFAGPIPLPDASIAAGATAYLVAVFKLVDNVPIFVGVDIFSEPAPTVGGDQRCWVVHQIEDVTYSKAKDALLCATRTSPWLAWVIPHLPLQGVL